MTITFRLAVPADLPTILSLLAGEVSGLTKQKLDIIINRIQRYPDYQIWLVEHDSAIIGAFTLVIIDGISHSGKSMAVMNQIAIRPDTVHDEAEYSSILFAKDLARQRGCRQLVLADTISTQVGRRCEDIGFSVGPMIIDPQTHLAMSGR